IWKLKTSVDDVDSYERIIFVARTDTKYQALLLHCNSWNFRLLTEIIKHRKIQPEDYAAAENLSCRFEPALAIAITEVRVPLCPIPLVLEVFIFLILLRNFLPHHTSLSTCLGMYEWLNEIFITHMHKRLVFQRFLVEAGIEKIFRASEVSSYNLHFHSPKHNVLCELRPSFS
uniref:Uncharacterized protein n=1 Tax=Glossina austeni TaxID=7395 RepID=A0A1A9UW82_GLOAU